jgi:uncharacterized protein YjiS (DUF1127 family)
MTTLVANTFNWIGLESIARFFVKLNEARIRRKEIRQTMNALSNLTDRELNDMGIARGDIWAVAHGDPSFKRSGLDADANSNLKGWV